MVAWEASFSVGVMVYPKERSLRWAGGLDRSSIIIELVF